MNKTEFINAIATRSGVKDTKKVIEAMIEVIPETLKTGEQITITGFGTFKNQHKEATTARNPKTGETIDVAAKNVPKFSFSKTVKDFVK